MQQGTLIIMNIKKCVTTHIFDCKLGVYNLLQMALRLNIIHEDLTHPYFFISWNVNGYSNKIHTWLLEYVNHNKPDIVFLSETKRKPENLPFNDFVEYNCIINSHEPGHWHGVAMLIHKKHYYQQFTVNLNISNRKDTKSIDPCCGRIIAIKLNTNLNVIGSYTPNSGITADPIKYNYRVQLWDAAFISLLDDLKRQGPTVWMGDINVALDDIDVCKSGRKSTKAGFTPQERNNLRSILSTGEWIDAWRYQHPTEIMYTWCGINTRRPTEYGMRLDNIIVSKNLTNKIYNTFMLPDCSMDSDHIPVCIYLNK